MGLARARTQPDHQLIGNGGEPDGGSPMASREKVSA
jgi:hypothetical protein